MRKRYRILLVVLLVAVLGGLTWQVSRPRQLEPIYQGKPLSVWLAEYYESYSTNSLTLQAPAAVQARTENAVRQIGTNGIPTLLQMLRARNSQLTWLGTKLSMQLHLTTNPPPNAVERNIEAEIGFWLLGEDAKYAVPALVEIYDQNFSKESQGLAALALGRIGPPARMAIPSLLREATNKNEFPRTHSIWALTQIRGAPAVLVPALTQALHDPSLHVRSTAAVGLGGFGEDAKSAVPALVQALKDPDYSLRVHVKNALKQIDPEAAAKAGVK
ncbi:MAG: repeat protein [Pedosphaera sp.]|nr:repeat protein [Pedosphaera sp.]